MGAGKGIRLGSVGKGPLRVRCPWAPNVLATKLVNVYNDVKFGMRAK